MVKTVAVGSIPEQGHWVPHVGMINLWIKYSMKANGLSMRLNIKLYFVIALPSPAGNLPVPSPAGNLPVSYIQHLTLHLNMFCFYIFWFKYFWRPLSSTIFQSVDKFVNRLHKWPQRHQCKFGHICGYRMHSRVSVVNGHDIYTLVWYCGCHGVNQMWLVWSGLRSRWISMLLETELWVLPIYS